MDELLNAIPKALRSEQALRWMRAIFVLIAGMTLSIWLPRRLALKTLHPQASLAIRLVTRYALISITAIWTLRVLGIDLSVLLGAAGVLTVAVGFASQTSASNLISGLFLMVERPFVVGDLITLADLTGEVISVDPLSVKLKTFDNVLVRIPNETVLKSNVSNLTHYPVRRYDLKLNIAPLDDLDRVVKVLMEVADRVPICLEEPKPQVIYLEYGESWIQLQLSTWAATERFFELRRTMFVEVRRAFVKHGVRFAFPHRTVQLEPAMQEPADEQ